MMEAFLKSIERQAYGMALFSCGNRDDALDLVQDAMCRFVDKYGRKPQGEWRALFYRVLQNGIRDHYRRQAIRQRWRIWFGAAQGEGEEDPLAQLPDQGLADPETQVRAGQSLSLLQGALRQLPLRQQQVFLLRCWQELSVTEAAEAMGCSEGSVKTHLSRALQALKKKLGKDWP